jgi:hypothetical protein
VAGRTPRRIERHGVAGHLARREAEQGTGPGRGQVQLHAVLVAVVADRCRVGVEAAEQRAQALDATGAAGVHHELQRGVELDDERQVT